MVAETNVHSATANHDLDVLLQDIDGARSLRESWKQHLASEQSGLAEAQKELHELNAKTVPARAAGSGNRDVQELSHMDASSR